MREIKQRFWLRLTTWATLTACFSVLIGAAVAATNLTRLLTLWGDDIQVTAYLAPETSETEKQNIEADLRRNPAAGRVEFVSRERALTQFRDQLSSYAPDLAGDDELLTLIPSSFQISLASSVPAERQVNTLREMAAWIGSLKGIEEVRYGQEWIKRYASVVSATRGSFLFIGAVLLLAAFFVVGNAVRASIDSRRNEIEVLELVGATPWMIRRPFLMEGGILGFLSGVSALTVMALLFGGLQGMIVREMDSAALSANLSFLPLPTMIAVAFAAGGLGALSSFVCIRRINTGFAAAGGRE